MMLELQHYFGELYTDHSVRVVVIPARAAGSAPGSISRKTRRRGTGPVAGLRVQRRVSEIVMRMRRAPQPIIALINGPASGGGFALALASDIRIAAPAARMNAAFIRIGLTACDVGVSYFLPRLVGSALASELLLTGRFIDAERAQRVGLVSQVVAQDELLAAGRTMAQEILGQLAGRRAADERVPEHEYRCRQPRGGDCDGGPPADPRRADRRHA